VLGSYKTIEDKSCSVAVPVSVRTTLEQPYSVLNCCKTNMITEVQGEYDSTLRFAGHMLCNSRECMWKVRTKMAFFRMRPYSWFFSFYKKKKACNVRHSVLLVN